MDPFQAAQVGQTNVWMTRLGLGGAGYAGLYGAVEERQAAEAITEAYQRGISYFDTAPVYGHGQSEERLNSALLTRCDRSTFAIGTKVGRVLEALPPDQLTRDDEFPDALPLEPVYDFTHDGVMRSFEDSLRRLGTDHVEILYIHDPDEETSLSVGRDPKHDEHVRRTMDQTYGAVQSLRAQGAVKAIGVGMNQWEMLYDLATLGDFDCFLLAGRYTLLEQEPLATFLPLCEEKHISVIIGGPYNSGILATGAVAGARYNYRTAPLAIVNRVLAIERVCARYGVPLPAAALQFPFSHPAVAAVIPGARSAAEVRTNIEYLQTEIPGNLWEELRESGLIPPETPLDRLTIRA
jgi:D-threo-aldose 1-dehydrogenase